MMRLITFILIISVLSSSCRWDLRRPKKTTTEQQEASAEEAMDDMVNTDKAFSEASAKEGMKKAFLAYVADEAVLLRPGYMPIVDGDVIKFLNAQEDTSFNMTWEPHGADIAAANDMGYTYGVYTVKARDTILKGTYLSIWKKEEDGKWKFVLDTGNSGVGEKAEN
jgi:ketosteroid isomerase-like protein